MESRMGRLALNANYDDCDSDLDSSVSAYASIKARRDMLIKMHSDKISDAIVRLGQLKKPRTMSVEEMNDHLKLLEAEKRTLVELRDQQHEFETFSNSILEFLQNVGDDDPAIFSLEFEFSLECKRFESALPIYSKKSAILHDISNHQVTIITAETGSGKSTQIVQYIHQQYGNQNVVCTQPRKVAAISLAKRVAEEMDSHLGRTVGYRVGTSEMTTNDTSIFFVTDHMLLNECLDDRELQKYKFIIVDEAHERSIPTDLLLAMVKKALDRRPELRLIISSATIDPQIFKDYFKEKAVCLHVHGRTFPVQVVHEDVSIGSNHLKEAVRKTKHIHQTTEKEGDVLVFLTTPGETEKAQEMIETDKSLEGTIYCLVLHGRLLPEEQQRVFEPTSPGKRKVVFATNSAETSITIPNIRYVVDSGMVKEKHYDKERNISLLRVGPVNKSSAIQRQGRAGRTQEGKCFRLYTEEEYKAMKDEMLPEILRENLGIALLKLYQFGIEDPLYYDFVQPPSKESLEMAQHELCELGALQNNKLTRHGKIMAALGVEPKLAKFVALAIDDGIADGGIAYDAMVVAAVCSIGSSVFFRAGSEDDKQAADRLKIRFCKEHGDLITMLEVFKEWENLGDRQKNAWCCSNSMNAKTLRYTNEMVLEMISNIERLNLGINLDTDFADIEEVTRKVPRLLSRCFAKNVAFFSGHVRGSYYIPHKEKERFYLHPSASLSYLNMTPKWLLFTEILCTSRTYIINTSVLPDHLGEMLFGRVAVPRIKPQFYWTIGKATARTLGLGRWDSSQEQQMQEEINENIYIGFDANMGKVTLYTEDEHAVLATTVLDNAIVREKRNFERRLYEMPLSDGNPTSVVLQKGGVCSEVLEQGEFNSILLRRLDESVSKERVEKEFEKFGAISEVIHFRTQNNDTWGKVIYQKNASAALAVKNYSGYGYFAIVIVKPAWRIENNQVRQQKYAVQARWTRLPAKGNYAFITLKDPALNSEFVGQRKMVGNSFYQFQKANKGNDLKVNGINAYVSNDEIQLAIENQYPHVKIAKCTVPRGDKEIESKDTVQAIQRQFSLSIGRLLNQENQLDRKFWVRIKPVPYKKCHDFVATIDFKHLKDATTIANSNIVLGSSAVRLQLEKTSPAITIPNDVYSFVRAELTTRIKRIQNVKLQVKDKKNRRKGKPSNEVEITLELTKEDSESLSKARTVLYDLALGERIKFTEEQFRYFLTPSGKTFIETLEVQGACLIKLDRRIRSLVLYSPLDIRQELKARIESKRELNQREAYQWTLDLNSQPNGFIKVLTQQYGVRLTTLYDLTDASYININFYRQQLEVYGTIDSLKEAKRILEELASDLDDSTNSRRSCTSECPICRGTLETTSYQLEICSHSYCKECIQAMCNHAAQNKQLPLKCTQVGCDQEISIENILDLTEDEEIVPIAVELFIAKNHDRYRYCITPDCMNVYSMSHTADPEPYECAICQVTICTHCHVEYHDNVACSINRRGQDEVLKSWQQEPGKDRGFCPKCSAPIERDEGCKHVACPSCKSHVCWRCKKMYFHSLVECYSHMALCKK